MNMNILEMKGAFMGMLAQVEDEELLRGMLEKCVEMLNRTDMLDDLSPEVIKALEAADLDFDLDDTIPNDAVFQQLRAWQK
jgi:hypothetical protein